MARTPLRRAGGLFPIQSGIAASPPARLGPSARYVGTSLRSTSPRGHVATRPRRHEATSWCRCRPVVSVRLRSRGARPSALRAHWGPPLGLPLFPRVGFFGGAGCPSIRETHPAPPKKLRAEGRGDSSGNVLPHEAVFSFDRVRVRGEVACESVARSSASLWRGRVRACGEVACEPVARSSASQWRGRARVRGEVACEPVTSRSRAGEPGCGERAGSEQVWDNQRRAFSPASTRA